MSDLYTNMKRELDILRHAAANNYNVCSQFVDGSKVMFTVDENDLPAMKQFCLDEFGSCEVVEEIGSIVMCRVE